uniref:Ras-like protein family member 12 n=1 Tax=Panagrolaimus sp. ES5 TaxID=591445 RepID=A0AC34GXA6_9BILA
MDTVDSAERPATRYLAWADIFVVVYDITSRLSFQLAEQFLQQIALHQSEHSLCARENHKTLLLATKSDLERYRQVNESDGEKLAKKYSALFSEICATGQHSKVLHALHKPIEQLMKERASKRSPSPRLYSSDSEIQRRQKGFSMSLKNVARSGTLRRSKSPKAAQQKQRTGSKLLKLFHN